MTIISLNKKFNKLNKSYVKLDKSVTKNSTEDYCIMVSLKLEEITKEMSIISSKIEDLEN
tara:strand:- start:1231 stop:1410 length:180 start_codon:yes stop_codon:yes gene_type:complete